MAGWQMEGWTDGDPSCVRVSDGRLLDSQTGRVTFLQVVVLHPLSSAGLSHLLPLSRSLVKLQTTRFRENLQLDASLELVALDEGQCGWHFASYIDT